MKHKCRKEHERKKRNREKQCFSRRGLKFFGPGFVTRINDHTLSRSGEHDAMSKDAQRRAMGGDERVAPRQEISDIIKST